MNKARPRNIQTCFRCGGRFEVRPGMSRNLCGRCLRPGKTRAGWARWRNLRTETHLHEGPIPDDAFVVGSPPREEP